MKHYGGRTEAQREAVANLCEQWGAAVTRMQNDGRLWVQFGRLNQLGTKVFLVEPSGEVIEVRHV